MKGTITPSEPYSCVKNISESHTLNIDIPVDKMDEKLYTLIEIVKALIVSGERFSNDDAMITRAENITKKIFATVKKTD